MYLGHRLHHPASEGTGGLGPLLLGCTVPEICMFIIPSTCSFRELADATSRTFSPLLTPNSVAHAGTVRRLACYSVSLSTSPPASKTLRLSLVIGGGCPCFLPPRFNISTTSALLARLSRDGRVSTINAGHAPFSVLFLEAESTYEAMSAGRYNLSLVENTTYLGRPRQRTILSPSNNNSGK
ncbi:hypothetical protein F5Y05DRAFT_99605 [Hypoxylon sp. FL0543]|nr:hypothetical protein F5Y05DRAFT_99605 [Hypoxylon sp. FL0543]